MVASPPLARRIRDAHYPGLLHCLQGGFVSVCGSTDFGKMEVRGKFLLDGNPAIETNRRG